MVRGKPYGHMVHKDEDLKEKEKERTVSMICFTLT